MYTILGAQETCVNNFKGRLGCLIGSWLEVSGIRLQGYFERRLGRVVRRCVRRRSSGAVALDYVRGRAQQPVRPGGNACRWPGQRRSEGGRHGAAFHRTVGTGCPRPSALPEGGGFRRSPQGPRHRRAGARGSLLLQGDVPLRATPEVVTDQALYQVGGLLRSYHEAVSGFELPSGIDWFHEPVSGSRMVVCHNDLAPKNTVFREGRPVAFLDWDLTAPPHRCGIWRTPRGSSFPSRTTGAARVTALHAPRTAPTGCASCATGTGCRAQLASGFRGRSRSVWTPRLRV